MFSFASLGVAPVHSFASHARIAHHHSACAGQLGRGAEAGNGHHAVGPWFRAVAARQRRRPGPRHACAAAGGGAHGDCAPVRASSRYSLPVAEDFCSSCRASLHSSASGALCSSYCFVSTCSPSPTPLQGWPGGPLDHAVPAHGPVHRSAGGDPQPRAAHAAPPLRQVRLGSGSNACPFHACLAWEGHRMMHLLSKRASFPATCVRSLLASHRCTSCHCLQACTLHGH